MRKGKTGAFLIGILLLLYPVVFPVAALASPRDTVVMTVDGVAPIRGHDYAGGRDQAIGDALRRSLGTALSGFLAPDQIVKQARAIEGLYGRVEDFIVEYRILGEIADEGFYRVSLSATVSTARIADALERDLPTVTDDDWAVPPRADAVVVRINGISNYRQYGTIKRFISEAIPCVTAVHERSFEFGAVEFEVHRETAEPECLAMSLAGSAFRDMHLVVRSSTEDRIDLDVFSW